MNEKIKRYCAAILFATLVTYSTGCSNLFGETKLSNKTEMHEAIKKKHNNDRLYNLKLSLFLVDSRIVLNQPVSVTFRAENYGTQPVDLDLGANFKEGLIFTIIYPDSARVDLPEYSLPPLGGPHLTGRVSVEPQKTFTRTYVLNEWVDIKQTGSYTLEGKLKTPIKAADGSFQEAPTLEVRFTVEPEDETHLKELCENYVKRLNNNDYSEAVEISSAIIFFNSPVAVPCIKKALISKKPLSYNLINSLRARATLVSVDALIGFIMEQPASELTNYARTALEFIRSTTKDHQIKQRIESERHKIP
jgi:hypothetical protein